MLQYSPYTPPEIFVACQFTAAAYVLILRKTERKKTQRRERSRAVGIGRTGNLGC